MSSVQAVQSSDYGAYMVTGLTNDPLTTFHIPTTVIAMIAITVLQAVLVLHRVHSEKIDKTFLAKGRICVAPYYVLVLKQYSLPGAMS